MTYKKLILATLLASGAQLSVATETQIQNEVFASDLASWSWDVISVTSNENWEPGTNSGKYYAVISGYGADSDSNDWLVSPALDLTSLEMPFVYAQFDSATKYTGDALKLMVSTDYTGDVENATWTDISELASWSGGDFAWVNSGKVNLSTYVGNTVHLAFHYTGTPSASAKWEIDFVEVYNSDEDPSVQYQSRSLESFDGDDLGKWNAVSLSSNKSWYRSSYSDNGYAKMSGYGGDEASNDWLVSEKFDMSKWAHPYFQFSNSTKYDGEAIKVLISTDYNGDVASATWTDLSERVAAWSSGNYAWAESGRIDLSELVEGDLGLNVHLAFQYTSTLEAAATWQVDNLDVGAEYKPGVISPIESSSEAFEAFDLGLGQWSETSVSGSKVWQASSYKGANFAKISGYNDDAASDDWLISPVFDMSGWAQKTISFYSASKYNGPQLKLLVSGDFDGTVATATWTDITDQVSWSSGNFEWVQSGLIDVSAVVSDKATFAFHYVSDDSGAATWEIDSLSVGGKAMTRPVESNYTTYELEEFVDSFGLWTAVSKTSDKDWATDFYIDTHFAQISGDGGDTLSDDWLISPTIDTTAADWDEAFVQFASAKNVDGNYDGDNLKLLVSTDYAGDVQNIAAVTWVDISDRVQWSEGEWTWIDSGEVDLSDFIGGNITLAFQYTSSEENGAATWRLDYVRIVEKDNGFAEAPYDLEPVSGGGSTGLIGLLSLLVLGLRRRFA